MISLFVHRNDHHPEYLAHMQCYPWAGVSRPPAFGPQLCPNVCNGSTIILSALTLLRDMSSLLISCPQHTYCDEGITTTHVLQVG